MKTETINLVLLGMIMIGVVTLIIVLISLINAHHEVLLSNEAFYSWFKSNLEILP